MLEDRLVGADLTQTARETLRWPDAVAQARAQVALQYKSDPIERIAEETGFTSLSHLSREFRRHYGVSPRAYRASHGARSV